MTQKPAPPRLLAREALQRYAEEPPFQTLAASSAAVQSAGSYDHPADKRVQRGAPFMNIRSYEESDLVAAVELFTSSVRDLTTRHYDEGQRAAWAPATPDLSAWKERLSTLQTVIAEQGRVLAGFIAYRQDGYIDLLYTSPDFPRQGIASALYREAETALAATGTRELSVHASLTALPFFEHQGFQIQEEQHVLRSGVSFRRFAMRKLLA